jgi:gliding motility-associated-like protein
MNLLDNDFDAFNDLDTLSLIILTKTEFGEVTPGQKGTIIYKPLIQHTGTERFYYRICDNNNQCDSASVVITIKDPPLFLPEGISPNGDGVNDRFVIRGLNAYPKSSLTIFSRDGMIIFDTDDYQNDWDGMNCNKNQNAKMVPNGTYYYLLHPGGSTRAVKGFIYLTN